MHSTGHVCGPSSAAPESPQYGGRSDASVKACETDAERTVALEEPRQRSPDCTFETGDDPTLTSPSGMVCAGPALASPPQTPLTVACHPPVLTQNLSPVKNLMREVRMPGALHT
jgi:hypothetical protein